MVGEPQVVVGGEGDDRATADLAVTGPVVDQARVTRQRPAARMPSSWSSTRPSQPPLTGSRPAGPRRRGHRRAAYVLDPSAAAGGRYTAALLDKGLIGFDVETGSRIVRPELLRLP